MSSEEKNAYGALIAFGITVWFFGLPIWSKTNAGAYNAPTGLEMWGKDVLWLMGGGIVIAILVTILTHIVAAIATGDENPETLIDERDQAISRRGTLFSLIAASCGFIGAVISLALGQGAVFALNSILLGMLAGACMSEIVRIAHYRFGL